MKNKHNNSNQSINTPKQVESTLESNTAISGATKKCPNCGEELPEKIAFCLYCMKPLTESVAQKSTVMPHDNSGKGFQSTSTKVLIGAAALFAIAAIVVATSFITAFIVTRQSTSLVDHSHYRSAVSSDGHPLDLVVEPAPTPTPTPQHTEQLDEYLPIYLPIEVYSPTTNHTDSSSQHGNRPSNPPISLECAIEIGYEELARRGHSGTFSSDSGIDWERGQWVWELLFRVEGGRLPLVEMYINVDTGTVVKFEWDD